MVKKTKTEYRFNEEKHIHELKLNDEWKPLQGVTSVLQVISKPQLIPWAVKMATDYVAANWEAEKTYSKETIETILLEAKAAHRKKKEVAGDWGVEVHKWIESYIKFQTFLNSECPEPLKDNQKIACDNFVKWAKENRVKFLESEKHLYSEKHWLGGICDLVMEIDGEVWIGDIKTGSGIYPEHFLQMAAYDLMISEMKLYKNITGHIVINLKKTGEFETKKNCEVVGHKSAFLAALELYRCLGDIK